VNVSDSVSPYEATFASHEVRVMLLIYHFHVGEEEVEGLIYRLQSASYLHIVLQFEYHFLRGGVLIS
jgi:hypothetical protein